MIRNLLATAVAALTASVLAACSSGGTVTIADSQPADTQTADFQIAYVKRTIPTTTGGAMAQDDLRLPRNFFLKSDLYLLNPTATGGAEKNITARVTQGGNWDVKDVDVSSDGTRIIFAMRGPLTANQKDFNPPDWSIWEYVVASDYLHQICPTVDPTCGTVTDTGGAQYVSPHYLADGRILFATTRQFDSGSVLLNEGKPEFEAQTEDLDESAFVLHVMAADGTGLHQVSFNQSHDIDATLLNDGRILWTRWDHANGNDGMALYTSHPDGTDVQLAYGFGSHDTASTNPGGATTCPSGDDCTVEFTQPRELPDGRILALVRPYTNADFGGNVELIDTKDFVENNQANPDTPNNSGSSTTTLAEQSATENEVITACANSCSNAGTTDIPLISPGGRFSSAFPLWDGTGRILVTWSECRLQDMSGDILPCTADNLANTMLTAAPVLYSAWMFNPADNTFLPLTTPTEGVFVDDIVALQPRPSAPAYIPDSYTTTTSPDGILDIRSVYDWDGAACNATEDSSCSELTSVGGIAGMAQTAADQRPARFLRIVKAVSIPPQMAATGQEAVKFIQKTAFGSAGNYMREIIGYVPIEPDGSVRVQVPSDIAFQLDVVDVNPTTGYVWRDFPLHKAWLQLLPGEEVDCNGCHVPASQQHPAAGASFYSHGNASLFTSIWPGAASAAAFPGTTSGDTACQVGQTMAEALYQCTQPTTVGSPPGYATPSVNVTFSDPWFGGGTGNEPFTLSYTDAGFAGIPLPTTQACAQPGGWSDDCRIVISYQSMPASTAVVPLTGQIEALWDKMRTAPGGGDGTCSDCHNASTLATGWLNLTDGASGTDPNQENSYQQLMNAFSVSTTDPTTGVVTTTQERGAEFVSGSAAGSHFFQFFNTPDSIHTGLLSPAEMRLLSEWVDIGAQYYNNPFNAPTN